MKISKNCKVTTQVVLIFLAVIVFSLSLTVYRKQPLFADSQSGQEKCLLWSVHDGPKTSYILGSIHVANQTIYPLNSEIEEAFEQADTLVVEADVAALDKSLIQSLMAREGVYSDNSTLASHLSIGTYKFVRDELEQMGLSFEQFNMYRPWLLAITITNMKLAQMGYEHKWGLESYFLEKARGELEVVELEGSEEQIKFFAGLSEPLQELFLFHTIVDLRTLEEEMDTLISAWKQADIETIDRLLTKGIRKHPELELIYDILICQRSEKMYSVIKQLLQDENSYFIIVGVAHLIGEKSIIRLLRNNGYRVEKF
ncbi:MAG: TraB/GumN family protein [Candidatus Omnitrophica bacterium]|nr:TraB/GumN family protein [Candidatus Omnitrophota bacterium]